MVVEQFLVALLTIKETLILLTKYELEILQVVSDINTGNNPLEAHPTWKNTIHKATGKNAVRETDTLDTFR